MKIYDSRHYYATCSALDCEWDTDDSQLGTVIHLADTHMRLHHPYEYGSTGAWTDMKMQLG